MGKVTSLQPVLRFSGFNGDWSEKWLGNVCSIGDVDHWMPQTVSEGIPYLMTGDFVGINELDFANAKLISETDYGRLSRKIKPEYGDILFARYASVGAVRYVNTNQKFQISYSCAILKKPRNYDSKFLFYNIQSPKFQKKVEQEINTGSQRNIGIDSLKKIEVFFPNNTVEQTKIGDFFQNLDQQIKLNQDKHNKLQQLKKAMLGKMFPKYDEEVPKVRFSGCNGKWEELKLSDIGKTYSGLAGKTKTDFGKGSKYITYVNIFRNAIIDMNLVELVNVAPEEKQNLVKYGDIFFTTSSETPEEVGMSSVLLADITENVYLNSFCFGFRLKDLDCIAPVFMSYLLRSDDVRRLISFLAQGATRYNLSKSQLMKITLRFPSVEEQVKIGQYFQNLDRLIALQQQKINKLKNIQQACLGKMFA
ncbi:restriction endonuclease subunit S [Vibrio parahaemolyticus]|uniref:restriction endonuclease subunit S n=1 Tax=Vibrio parahaemolyticus TaxID=670 RepID=UPI0023EBD5BD|nr:restriction endonuclease subunit S [Vibrio parahaemolyticus]MDF5219308.1 restriction endonuclease subunit S [Vibrio parahaemolyticus]